MINRYLNAKNSCFDKIYSFLNKDQRLALKTVNGPLLVLAGAGSGKTTVLVNRIANIIRYGSAYESDHLPSGITDAEIQALENALALDTERLAEYMEQYAYKPCPSFAILCITFTNKAATEMKERLSLVLGDTAEDIWAGTFHNICMRILRKFPSEAGLESGFTIYDTDDQKKLISTILKDFCLDEKRYTPKGVINAICRAKENLLSCEEYEKEIGNDFYGKNIAKIYTEYQKRMQSANAVDFDDIIVKTVYLLRDDQGVRDYYQHRFKYVCIDEYQDTNKAQLELAILLSGKYRNLMVVGDDDQSIYKFRGATIENILNFDKQFPDARVVKLEQNYRSTKNIIATANSVISQNVGRHSKKLWTDKGDGDRVTVKQLGNQNDEARFIVDYILTDTVQNNNKFSDYAVLYRVNAQSNSLESAFAKSGIPYRIIGGTRFYERKEIKDIIAYLCLISSHADNLRLKRIINEPKRGIGAATIDRIEKLASYDSANMFDIIANADKYTVFGTTSTKLLAFAKIINELSEIAQRETLSEVVRKTIELSGYRDALVLAGKAEEDRVRNIDELVSNAVAYEEEHEGATLANFLEEVALIADIDNYDDETQAVVLMTVHSAKGLEFDNVFLPGLEEGLFPSAMSMGEREEMEEERRLCYVAITRARKKLICTYVKDRLMYGRTNYNLPSRFIDDFPADSTDFELMPKRGSSLFAGNIYTPSASFGTKKYLSPDYNPGGRTPSAFSPQTKSKPLSVEKFNIGDEVAHMKYGHGIILSVTDLNGDYMYEIAFDNVGTKKLMATYAKLKKS